MHDGWCNALSPCTCSTAKWKPVPSNWGLWKISQLCAASSQGDHGTIFLTFVMPATGFISQHMDPGISLGCMQHSLQAGSLYKKLQIVALVCVHTFGKCLDDL